MSTPTGEPILGADYESRERLIAWDAVAVAADHQAMAAALKEFITLKMFEQGIAAGLLDAYRLFLQAQSEAVVDYLESEIIKKAQSNV